MLLVVPERGGVGDERGCPAERGESLFGLVALDYETQACTVRESGRFYADISAQGGVTDEAYDRWVAGRAYPMN